MNAIQKKSILTKRIMEAGTLSTQLTDEVDKRLTPQEKITQMIKMKNILKKLKHENEMYEKHNDKLENKNNELLNTQNALKEQITCLKRQLETSKKEQENNVKDQAVLIRNHEKEINKFQTEIEELTDIKREYLKILEALVHERRIINAGNSVLAQRIVNDNEEMNIKKTEVYVLKLELKEAAAELNQQKLLYHAVVAEKNKLERMFENSRSEIEKLKEKLKISNDLVKQTTKDSSINEKRIIKETTDLRKVVKEKEDLQKELNTVNNTIKILKFEKSALETEKKRLYQTITEHERLKKEHSKTVRQLKQERDTLNEQNAQKDEKIASLTQKVQMLKSKTQNGGIQQEQYLNNLKSLKEENKRLEQENKCLTRTHSRSRRPLIKQSTNIDKFECVRKIQLLQERLQQQSADLNNAKGALKEKEQNIKSLVAQLHKIELQAKQYKSAVQQAHAELDKLRKESVDLKKQHRLRRDNKQ